MMDRAKQAAKIFDKAEKILQDQTKDVGGIESFVEEAINAAHTHGWIQAMNQRDSGNLSVIDGEEQVRAKKRMDEARTALLKAVRSSSEGTK